MQRVVFFKLSISGDREDVEGDVQETINGALDLKSERIVSVSQSVCIETLSRKELTGMYLLVTIVLEETK